MTSNEVGKARVIHVDFKAEKRRKTTASLPNTSPQEPTPLFDTSVHSIRAWDQFNFRDRVMDISGWWIRLTVFITLVGLGYLALR